MEMSGEQVLPLARERVWKALLDTDTLRASIPGCESMTHEGDGAYAVTVVAAVGPVKARFKGRLQQQDMQPPQRYTLSFEGDGGMAGFARGSAEVDLSELAGTPARTRLVYRAQAQIGGRLAQIGSRLVDATAARMAAQFFDRLTQTLTLPAPEALARTEAAPAAVPAVDAATALAVSSGVPPAPAPLQSVVTLQMPAWTWAFTVAVFALLTVWLNLP